MKSVFSVIVPALLLMSASAFAADPGLQPSGGKTDPALSAGTGGLQGSITGQGYMNGPAGNGSAGNGAPRSSSMAANGDISPTYLGGRKAYRGQRESSLYTKEAQVTAQLNERQAQFNIDND